MLTLIMIMFLMILFLIMINMNPLLLALFMLFTTFPLFFFSIYMANSWFAMSIILIFSGGMMIIFLYMTSLCSNFKFNIMFNNFIYLILFLPPVSIFQFCQNMSFFKFNIFFVYNLYYISMFVFLVGYILLSLFFIVVLSQHFEGSLKKFY